MIDEHCRNCVEWAGHGHNLIWAYCNVLKKDTDAMDWCHEYKGELK